MLKTVEILTDNEAQQEIIKMATDSELFVREVPGALTDNYIIYDNESIRIGNRMKPRKYIIMTAKYLNEWSSGVNLIMTDSEKVLESYENLFDEWEREIEKEEERYLENITSLAK